MSRASAGLRLPPRRRILPGIYLLVWRGIQQRWQLPDGGWADFRGLIEALQRHWVIVAKAHPRVEEIQVIGIDLTKRAGGETCRKAAGEEEAGPGARGEGIRLRNGSHREAARKEVDLEDR